MRAIVQRVRSASVHIGNERLGAIGPGLLIYLGIGPEDSEKDVVRLAGKIRRLRIFDDESGKPNLALGDRQILCISQFTLFADTSRGNRPSYVGAADYDAAERLYLKFCEVAQAVPGRFGADMKVESINDGPMTIPIFDDLGL